MALELSYSVTTKEGSAMKKSKAIRLVLLGSTGLTLAACDQSPPSDATFFSRVEDCIAFKSESTCRDGFAKSEEQWVAEAPRFTKKEQCEAEFGAGNCETAQAGAGRGSFFMPMMMGYMLGNAFNRPVYRGPNNSAMVQTGGRFFNVGTFAGAGRTAPFQRAQFTPVQRGGFGSTASAHRTSAGS
jgi:uncharacterized protein YgiB involved in biofilm formation